MDIRQRRLQSDLERAVDLSRQSSLIDVQVLNDACDRYLVSYCCRGLIWPPERPRPVAVSEHRLQIYLHADYPRLPPRLEWLTDIFHPNILPPSRNGGVCIGKWSPAESLDRLILRIGEMVQYRNFSTSDALNPRAAEWARQHADAFPVDDRPLLDASRPVVSIALGADV